MDGLLLFVVLPFPFPVLVVWLLPLLLVALFFPVLEGSCDDGGTVTGTCPPFTILPVAGVTGHEDADVCGGGRFSLDRVAVSLSIRGVGVVSLLSEVFLLNCCCGVLATLLGAEAVVSPLLGALGWRDFFLLDFF